MLKLGDYENIYNIAVVDLTAGRLEEALEVFQIAGWDKDGLKCVKAEMLAFINGDIAGYIRARFIVALVNDSVVGVAAWAPAMCSFSVYELSWATVLPKWRHRGINTLMVQERIQKIREHHGPKPFAVLVYTWDNPMYANAGFVAMHPGTKHADDARSKQVLLAQFGSLMSINEAK